MCSITDRLGGAAAAGLRLISEWTEGGRELRMGSAGTLKMGTE